MNYDNYKYLLVDVDAEGVCIVTMNRPDQLNPAGGPMHPELERIWGDINGDARVKAVILTGAGRAFSAGGDLKEMAARVGTPANLKHALRAPESTRHLWQNMLELRVPLIAAVNGDARGLGCTLALFCDITVISETARIGDTHVKVGLVAGDGGTVIMPLLIGMAKARDLLLRGRVLTGKEAHDIGLITHLRPQDEVLSEAKAIARELAQLPPYAVAWTKLSVNKSVKEHLNQGIDASMALEMLTMLSNDHAAAVQAFVEKRKPEFKGD